MGFWVSFHIHNYVGTNRDNLVLGVGLNIGQSLTHQISGITLILLIWINFGVNKVALSWHQAVIR